ncbi:MAG: T9SS type A sorting domain-containing protein [Candidatus Kapaibacterium sp.]
MSKFLLLTMTLMILMSTLCIAESDTVWSKSIGSEVKAVKFSPDGQFIYAAAIGRKPMKLSTETGEILREYEEFKFEGNVFFMAMDVSSDGKWLICGAYGNEIHIFDTETGLIVKTLKADYEDNSVYKFTNVAISRDKRNIIGIYAFEEGHEVTKNGIVIWDAISGELIKTIESRWVMKVAVSPTNNYFCVSYFWSELDDKQSAIELYDLNTFEKIQDLGYHNKRIYDIAFSPDGSLLASGGWDGVIKIWDVEKKELMKEFGDNFEVNSVGFIGNDKVVGGCGYFDMRNMKIWDINSDKFLGQLKINFPLDLDISEVKHYCVVANNVAGILLFDYKKIISGISESKVSDVNTILPNPSNDVSKIQFMLPISGKYKISISDINSKVLEVLHEGFLEQGEHKFQWIPNGVPSGVYYCTITGQNFSKTLKIILEK